jgi:DNA-binding response OmpR family regulator
MRDNFTILVADKNRHVRDFLRRELSAEGYEVCVAKDGGQIFAEIDGEAPPDLLVFDLEMPDTESSRILETTQTRQPPLPVIIHTFLTEESARESVGTTEIYIEKSGNIDHLKSAIKDILEKFYPERA